MKDSVPVIAFVIVACVIIFVAVPQIHRADLAEDKKDDIFKSLHEQQQALDLKQKLQNAFFCGNFEHDIRMLKANTNHEGLQLAIGISKVYHCEEISNTIGHTWLGDK